MHIATKGRDDGAAILFDLDVTVCAEWTRHETVGDVPRAVGLDAHKRARRQARPPPIRCRYVRFVKFVVGFCDEVDKLQNL